MTTPDAQPAPRSSTLPFGLLFVTLVIGFGLGFKVGRTSAQLEQPGVVSPDGDEAEATPTDKTSASLPDDSMRTLVEPTAEDQAALAAGPGAGASAGTQGTITDLNAAATVEATRTLSVRLLGLEDTAAPDELMLHVLDPATSEVLGRNTDLELGSAVPGTSPAEFQVTALPPGEWLVTLLHKDDWGGNPEPMGEAAVDLRAGDATVELSLPALYTLEVLAPTLEVGKSLFLDRTEDLGHRSFGKYSAKVDANHVASFEGLAPDRYSLHGGGGPPVELEVPCAPFQYAPTE